MFDAPLGDNENISLSLRAASDATIASAAVSKLVITTAPTEGMYAGARIEIADPGGGDEENMGEHDKENSIVGSVGSLLNRTSVSVNGPAAFKGGAHVIEMIDGPEP